jgi:hypothetical protein
MGVASRSDAGGPPPPTVPTIALAGFGPANARSWGKPSAQAAQGRRAAQYVRMSTEHQRYSTENQVDAIRHYAEHRGLEVVRTYADEGRSGLRLDGRDGLKRLINDVQDERPISLPSWSTMSAAGAAFRTPTKAPTTNIFAVAPGFRFSTAQSNLRTTVVRSPLSSRVSSGRCLAITGSMKGRMEAFMVATKGGGQSHRRVERFGHNAAMRPELTPSLGPPRPQICQQTQSV